MSDAFHPSKIAHVAAAPTKDGQVCARCGVNLTFAPFPLLDEGDVVTIYNANGASGRQLHGKNRPDGYVECVSATEKEETDVR